MRVLIAYDGSPCSEAALDDLRFAGLPDEGEATVISVAEVWLPPPGLNWPATDETDIYLEDIARKQREKAERIVSHANILSKHAAKRIQQILPGWRVTANATYGSPAWEILTLADEIKPDLIVVGAQGHSLVGRLLLGSVSQKVLTESRCSVRIARGRNEVDPAPRRLIIGFDGSRGAIAAVDSVAGRNWGESAEVKLIAVTDSVSRSLDRFYAPPETKGTAELSVENKWLEAPIDAAKKTLAGAGVIVSAEIIEGNPNNELPKAAAGWGADCIFVGANAEGSELSRLLLGSTSSAVSARAHCSVEVVRRLVSE